MGKAKVDQKTRVSDAFTPEVVDVAPEIADLAAIGEQQLAAAADGRRQWAAEKADEREMHWDAMQAAAEAVLGKALLDTDRYKGKCPLDYRGADSSPWQFHLRPFGAGELFVRFHCRKLDSGPNEGSYVWELDETGMGGRFTDKERPAAYRVCQNYRPEMNPEAGDYQVAAGNWYNTADLATAVHLCQLQTQGFNDATAEAARLNDAMKQKK